MASAWKPGASSDPWWDRMLASLPAAVPPPTDAATSHSLPAAGTPRSGLECAPSWSSHAHLGWLRYAVRGDAHRVWPDHDRLDDGPRHGVEHADPFADRAGLQCLALRCERDAGTIELHQHARSLLHQGRPRQFASDKWQP